MPRFVSDDTVSRSHSARLSLVRRGLELLGIDRLLLAIHDVSFPSLPDEDVGRGSPYSFGAERFFEFVRALGFSGVQLGPQGKTALGNPSPFDASLFARSPLSVSLARLLAESPELSGLGPRLEAMVASRSPDGHVWADHAFAFGEQRRALAAAFALVESGDPSAPSRALDGFFEQNRAWLEPDGLFEALTAQHGTDDWRRWPGPDSGLYGGEAFLGQTPAARRQMLSEAHGRILRENAFAQRVFARQHQALRARLGELGLQLFGDMQIGISSRDVWRYEDLFVPAYRMGAPPSRTNPDGQPWGYPVLDPQQYESQAAGEGPSLGFFRQRVGKLLHEFDGLRIDHPHGLVCPWVYRRDVADPIAAVKGGARLFESPALPDHPQLARYAIARPEQITSDPRCPRYADRWLTALDEAQVARYARLFAVLIEEALRHGRKRRDLACEVLSTCPYPLEAVMRREGLGRFRVVQKADPADPVDPYRTSRAAPPDWVMLGTHDTPPIWRVVPGWRAGGAALTRTRAWAQYLAERLEPDADSRAAFARRLVADDRALVAALFADLFAGPARQVLVFFADLLGLEDVYNTPGTVNDTNWRLRVPRDYAERYQRGQIDGSTLSVAKAVGTALRARAGGAEGDTSDLAARLCGEEPEPRGPPFSTRGIPSG